MLVACTGRSEVGGGLSREGSYGHLGANPREIHVNEVVEAWPSRVGDCEATAP